MTVNLGFRSDGAELEVSEGRIARSRLPSSLSAAEVGRVQKDPKLSVDMWAGCELLNR